MITYRMKGRPVEILLVEDSPGDVELTVEALRDARVHNTLHVTTDGEEAMEFLRQEGRYKDAPRPDLVLLDLNLPKKSGREVLAEVKADPALRRIPVVILSTSENPDDVAAAYDLAANSYVTKPADLDQFIAAVRGIDTFWLALAKLPASAS